MKESRAAEHCLQNKQYETTKMCVCQGFCCGAGGFVGFLEKALILPWLTAAHLKLVQLNYNLSCTSFRCAYNFTTQQLEKKIPWRIPWPSCAGHYSFQLEWTKKLRMIGMFINTHTQYVTHTYRRGSVSKRCTTGCYTGFMYTIQNLQNLLYSAKWWGGPDR